MTEHEFNELAGRIEGLALAFLQLAAETEMQGAADGPFLCHQMRERADRLPLDRRYRDSTVRVLHHLADELDQARNRRQ